MNLYWCETADHEDDWFVVAPSAREARRFHEDMEGYGRGDARATLIRRIPRELLPCPKGWPEHSLLRALSGVFRSETTPRVVQFGDRVYEEGGLDAVLRRLEDDQAEVMGHGRPNGTTKLM